MAKIGKAFIDKNLLLEVATNAVSKVNGKVIPSSITTTGFDYYNNQNKVIFHPWKPEDIAKYPKDNYTISRIRLEQVNPRLS